jgi:hypothetical protein
LRQQKAENRKTEEDPMKNKSNYVRRFHGLILALTCLITVSGLPLGQAGLVFAQSTGPGWTSTGNLNTARNSHTATLLPNGKVLVAGGNDDGDYLNSAELYDPATGTWSYTGNLNKVRRGHTATLLLNGKVLVAGGNDYYSPPFNSAELYDPATATWSMTGNLNTGRSGHTATLLPNGKVLVTGGGDSAELYDPATETWSYTGSLNTPRGAHTATLLLNGKVLVAGGEGKNASELNSAELYDPATGTWSITGNLNIARDSHTATLLRNGNVLIAAGFSNSRNSAELYDPATGTWSLTGNLNAGRDSHTATLLPSGNVLVAGGFRGDFDFGVNSAELYDVATGTWTSVGNEGNGGEHTATLLLNGEVLVAGGFDDGSDNSAILYNSGNSYAPNPIDDSQFFIRQHYRDFLNREPDAAGLTFWTNEIASCGTDRQCVEAKRINVSAAFFLSIEFQETGYLVYRMYKSAYGDPPGAPVPITFSEFLADTREIGQGVVVNQSGWQQALENNKQAFTAEFVQRPRFVSAYPASLPPDQFVNQLFANAGVTPSAANRAAAINEFGSAVTSGDAGARARALRDVAENTTLAQQEFNRAFVLMQYFGYLRRNPNDSPDSNFDGYNFWLNKLNSFSGDSVQAEMVKAFITSDEYRRRFGP